MFKKFIAIIAIACFGFSASATIITTPLDVDSIANGDHSHSSSSDSIGVGYWDSEETRGVVEFDISSLSGAALLSFDFVAFTNQLSYGQDGDYLGDFNLTAYDANGDASNADYNAVGTLLGNYTVNGMSYGDSFSIDISSIMAIATGDYIGFVFDPTSANGPIGYEETVLSNFAITTVPEPSTLLLMSLGLLAFRSKSKK